MRLVDDVGRGWLFLGGPAPAQIPMGCAALGIAVTARTSGDTLARPLARASVVLAALAVAAGVLLALVTIDA
jgi:hypothetical protein